MRNYMAVPRPEIAALAVVALLAMALALRTALTIAAAADGDPARPADAIVVLGAAAHDGRPCAELRARLDHAAALHARGLAPVVVCSGGWTGSVSEAGAMRDALTGSVPDEAIVLDEQGCSTRATVARAAGFGRVLLVSSPWHVHRVRAEARRQGLDAQVVGAPASPMHASPRARRRAIA